MPISFTCSDCGKRLKARDELAGKLLPCPDCGRKVQIPEAGEDIAAYLLQEESPPPISTPPSVSEPASEEEEEQIPVQRKSSRPVTKTAKTETLPPLTTNDPPLWLRHLHPRKH